MYLVFMMKKPADIFTAAVEGVKLDVVQQPGDPIGFCPVFATREEALAAYPDAQIMEVLPPVTPSCGDVFKDLGVERKQ
jgi:hypothetical protein